MGNLIRRLTSTVLLGACLALPLASSAEEAVWFLSSGPTPRMKDVCRRWKHVSGDHTMALFEKHGMRNVGYWIPVDKPNTLIYIIAHDSAGAIQNNWKSFVSDPAWQKVAEESQRMGRFWWKVGLRASSCPPRTTRRLTDVCAKN